MTPVEFVGVYNARMRAQVEQEKREWQRTASMMALVANVNRDPKRKPQPYRPEDFMPRIVTERAPGEGQPRRQQTQAEMIATIERINRAMRGRDLRQKQGEQEEA